AALRVVPQLGSVERRLRSLKRVGDADQSSIAKSDLVFKWSLKVLEHALKTAILQHSLKPLGYSPRQHFTGRRTGDVKVARKRVSQHQMPFYCEFRVTSPLSDQFISH